MKIVSAFPESDKPRVNYAAMLCKTSLKRFEEIELIAVKGSPRPFLDEMLTLAAEGSSGEYFGWINGDCQLLTAPSQLPLQDFDIYGLRRLELGIGEQCGGVDGYFIRKSFWESTLSRDLPHLYVGGTHVDWWLSRGAQRFGRYGEGFWLGHIPHERTSTSLGLDQAGVHNLREYNAWADRNGVSKDEVWKPKEHRLKRLMRKILPSG
jgi:hypothetical protein